MMRYILLCGAIGTGIVLAEPYFISYELGVLVYWLLPVQTGFAASTITLLKGAVGRKRQAVLAGVLAAAVIGVVTVIASMFFALQYTTDPVPNEDLYHIFLGTVLENFVPAILLGGIGGWLGVVLSPSRTVLAWSAVGLIGTLILSHRPRSTLDLPNLSIVALSIPLFAALASAYYRSAWDTSVFRHKVATEGGLTGLLAGSLASALIAGFEQERMCSRPNFCGGLADYDWYAMLAIFILGELFFFGLGYGAGWIAALLNRTPRVKPLQMEEK